MRTRIKICGITRKEDLDIAVQLGVDAIGLVFYPRSERYISLMEAKKLLQRKPPLLSVVAVFMDASRSDVMQVIQNVPINYLQFHGSEDKDFCRSFTTPYWKAVPMGSVSNFSAYVGEYLSTTAGFLLDSNKAGQSGGTGCTFQWSEFHTDIQLPMIVSGGLTADNVADSIRYLRPYAVDVSGGVESHKGIKDEQLMKQFVDAVRKADEDLMHV